MTSSVLDAHFQWHILQCHPASPHHHVKHVRCGIYRHSDSIALCYEITGSLHSIKVPPPQLAARCDELWRHTCAELFIANKYESEYIEFNFSPSTQWAAYSFINYRQGMMPLAIESPSISHEIHDSMLRVQVDVRLPESYRDSTIRAGMCMVIENSDGACSYWALQHDSPRPDFHRRENW